MEKYAYVNLTSKHECDRELKMLVNTKHSDEASLTWHNINVFLTNRKTFPLNCWANASQHEYSKKILKNVNGIAYSNQLLAIMGSSGAGKTTLVNVLTKRTPSSHLVNGEVRICGNTISEEAFRQKSAYVQQEDLFIGALTVREHLIFQALLRMNQRLSYAERMTRVEEIICEFGLTDCANTNIGMPGISKGISGGEIKRLAIAAEVLTDPLLMFCDEPTSGLDSFMAQTVVKVLKEMAAKGKIVIIAIHQPSSEVFAMFDRILLMAEGRTAFLGTKDGAYEYFKNQGFECLANFNPADFYISTLAIVPGIEKERINRVDGICDQFEVSDEGTVPLNALITNERSYNGEYDVLWTVDYTTRYKVGCWAQFQALMWRSIITYLRDTSLLKTRFFHLTMVILWTGIMFFGQTLNQEGVININSAIFLLLAELTFAGMYGAIARFSLELPLFYREHESGMYGTGPYFWAKTTAEAPLFAFVAVIISAFTYWMTGLNPGVLQFIFACGIGVLVSQCACSFGYMTSTCSGSIASALLITGTLTSPLLYFSSFFVNAKSFSKHLGWIANLFWLRFANEAMFINQWQHVHYIECNQPENQTCLHNGDEVLKSFNFNPNYYSYDIMILVVQFLAYRFIAYLALLSRANTRR